jgi:squalene-hopene/tetraprenyl-beta-curcumene cyclase
MLKGRSVCMNVLVKFTTALIAIAMAGPTWPQQWNPKLAASYLDAREQQWFDWKISNPDNKPCLSCHTGLPYLLVRPKLSRQLGEAGPTKYETGLLEALRSRVSIRTPLEILPDIKEPAASQSLGVEAILSCVTLAMDDSKRGSLSNTTEQAFDRLWSLQRTEGDDAGAWQWNSLDLDPYEMPVSSYFGAALAALAVAATPASYQTRADVAPHIASLKRYLQTQQRMQPLHNRLLLLWASSNLKGLLMDKERRAILKTVWRAQRLDGGWSLESLGPWQPHPQAPTVTGASNYATALTVFVLRQAGVSRSDQALVRAMNWLARQQNSQEGYWEAVSMNKRYEAGSMPLLFMRDAATSYAALALLE